MTDADEEFSWLDEYPSVEARYLREKDDVTVRALLDGIRSEEEARRWLGAMNRLGIEDWRRDWVLEYLGEG